jgi:formylglycine-generating enzyme required for sulfatase activity
MNNARYRRPVVSGISMQGISRLRLHLLGGFSIFPDGAPDQSLSIPSRKAQALLAYLAMQPEPRLTRGRLAALLWAGRFDKQARQSLRQCLLSLRKQLEAVAPGLLVLDDELVSLSPQLLSTDAREFVLLAEEGANPECALILYRGEFLAGFRVNVEPFDDWVREERARLATIAARLVTLPAPPDSASAVPINGIEGGTPAEDCLSLIMRAHRDAATADARTPQPLVAERAAKAPPLAGLNLAPTMPDWGSKVLHAWPLAALAGFVVLAFLLPRFWLLAPNQSVSASADHQREPGHRTAAPAARLGRIFKDCDICPEMVELPVGEFLMGSPQDERGREAIEGPQRRVVIGKRFALGRFEVTVDQLMAFMTETGASVGNACHTRDPDTARLGPPDVSFGHPGYAFTGSHPAVCVSWHEAQAYVTWLGRRTSKPYRLPSEAEWEYAARAGTTTRYSFGNDETELCHYARFADLASSFAWAGGCRSATNTRGPLQVGALKPNAWGLFDMHGNGWEWVADCWTADARELPTDGSAFTRPGYCKEGVIRGGGWVTGYAWLRSATRLPSVSAGHYYATGLRAALSLEGP